MKYIGPYPHIESVSLGPGFWSKLNAHNRTFPRPWSDFKGEISVNTENYERSKYIPLDIYRIENTDLHKNRKRKSHSNNICAVYTRIQQIVSNKSYDVVICDHFSTACSDVARVNKIPSIQTMVMNLSPGNIYIYTI